MNIDIFWLGYFGLIAIFACYRNIKLLDKINKLEYVHNLRTYGFVECEHCKGIVDVKVYEDRLKKEIKNYPLNNVKHIWKMYTDGFLDREEAIDLIGNRYSNYSSRKLILPSKTVLKKLDDSVRENRQDFYFEGGRKRYGYDERRDF